MGGAGGAEGEDERVRVDAGPARRNPAGCVRVCASANARAARLLVRDGARRRRGGARARADAGPSLRRRVGRRERTGAGRGRGTSARPRTHVMPEGVHAARIIS